MRELNSVLKMEGRVKRVLNKMKEGGGGNLTRREQPKP